VTCALYVSDLVHCLQEVNFVAICLAKVTTAKLKKFEKEYSAMKEQQEDPLERLQVFSTFHLYLLVTSSSRYE